MNTNLEKPKSMAAPSNRGDTRLDSDGNHVAAGLSVLERASESWYGELWHSTKYALVQSAFDGLRQDINHVAKVFTDKPLVTEHQFIEPVNVRNDWSAVGISQDVGAALGTLPYFLAVDIGLRKFLPDKKILAETLPLLSDVRAARVLRTAAAGAIVEGAFVPARDDSDWLKSKAKNSTAAFTTFAIAGGLTEGLASNSLSRDLIESIAGSGARAELARAGLTRLNYFATGAICGAAGGAGGNELASVAFDHKIASTKDLVNRSLKTAALMSTLSALRSGGDLTRQIEKISEQPQVDLRPGAARNSARAKLEDMEPRADAAQAVKLEARARQLAAKSDQAGRYRALSAAIDSYEALKRTGGTVDDVHLRQLYSDLANAKLTVDKP